MELPDGVVVHKIGMTGSDRTVDRMMEILRSWFTRFRYVPFTLQKLDMVTNYPKELEKHIHQILAHKRFTPHMKVEGRTEMFTGINEFRVLHYLRTFNEDLFPLKPLTATDYKHLGQLISP
jgi:hypothetical protein